MRDNIKLFWKVLYYGSFASFPLALVLIGFNLEILYIEFIDLTGVLGVAFLVFLLAFKNVYYYNKRGNSLFKKALRYTALCQKEIGLIIFNLFFIHSLFSIYVALPNVNTLIVQIAGIFIPLIIFIYLYITSFKFSQRRIKGWKKSHSIVWILYPLILLHVYQTMGGIEFDYFIIGVVLILSIIYGITRDGKSGRNRRQAIFLLVGIGLVIVQALVMKVVLGRTSTPIPVDNEPITNDSNTQSVSTTPSEAPVEPVTPVVTNSLYADGTYSGTAFGYQSNITVSVTTSSDEITSVTVDSINDTPGYYMRTVETIPQEIIAAQSTNVQVVSGATYSSNGIIEATQSALDQATSALVTG